MRTALSRLLILLLLCIGVSLSAQTLNDAGMAWHGGRDVGSSLPLVDSTFSRIPAPMQFFARNGDDSATVDIEGTLRLEGYDSIYVQISRNGIPWRQLTLGLRYDNGEAPFAFRPRIHAEPSEHRFTIGLLSAVGDTVIAVRDSVVCGDVILIGGQSNSIFGNGSATVHEFCRTFGLNFSRNGADTLWALARSNGNGGGPHVGAWGLRMQQLIADYADIPICVINGGVGGTTIEQHQRVDANPTDLRTIYGSMLYRARTSGLAAKARALLWYQGESNTIANYSTHFRSLYDDWRSDYPNLSRIYVVQIRPGCAAGEHQELRELLRTLPDSLPDVAAFSVMGIPGHDGCHFLPPGYDSIAVQLFRLVARDLYASPDTVDIDSPDIDKAFYTRQDHTELALVFKHASEGLIITPDTLIGGGVRSIRRSFFLDDSLDLVASARASSDTLYLSLMAPSSATTIAYIPDRYYPGTTVVYEGPWVKNRRGLGAFSFYRFPITRADPTTGVEDPDTAPPHLTALPNPFSVWTDLSITLPRPQAVEMSLYDMVGRRVLRKNLDAPAGISLMRIDGDDLRPGIYFCRMRGRNGERSLPIVVQR